MSQSVEQYLAEVARLEQDAECYLEWCEINDLDPGEDHHDSYRLEMDERHETNLESLAEARASGF